MTHKTADESDGSILRTTIRVSDSDKPAIIYYCKRYKKDGTTVMVDYDGKLLHCYGVAVRGGRFRMFDGNAKGKAKASKARCTLVLEHGLLDVYDRKAPLSTL